ncbi:sensor histidine kinase [Nannocystaceae bacterium ST9]
MTEMIAGTPAQAFLPRSLVAIAIAAGVHLGFAQLLLEPLTGRAIGIGDPLRLDVSLVVLTTAGIALALAVFAAIRRGPSVAARTAAPVLGLVPPLASVALVAPRGELLLELVPVLATTTAPGLALALALERALVSSAVRAIDLRTSARMSEHDPVPRGLASKLARLVGGLGLASCLLAIAGLLVRSDDPEFLLEPTQAIALAGLMLILVIAVVAGASAGLSPGRDVRALAERLDAIGWDDAASHDRTLASPVRITSFDAVGDLFRNLERLRARLADDVATYQSALDRTHEAETSKGEFLAAVSHELRTPLNSILGFAQLLLEQAPGAPGRDPDAPQLNEAQAEDVRLILAGGRKLLELLEDILDLSLIESGELELRITPCPIATLVGETVDIHRGHARERKLELRAELPSGLPAILCDPRRVGQVLSNLLSNAIKFTERGDVWVGARYDPIRKQVEIRVHDTGVGIRPEELDAIFEEYRQAGARKRRVAGTGLGLAIARRIAEAHGGSLVAQSELGVGSVFTLTLPDCPPPRRTRDEITGEQAIAVMQQSMRFTLDGLALEDQR